MPGACLGAPGLEGQGETPKMGRKGGQFPAMAVATFMLNGGNIEAAYRRGHEQLGAVSVKIMPQLNRFGILNIRIIKWMRKAEVKAKHPKRQKRPSKTGPNSRSRTLRT